MNELDAVNLILDGIGEAPVTSLDEANPDVEDALRHLRRVRREILSQGWSTNMSYDITLSPNIHKRIPLSPEVLRVETTGQSLGMRLISRHYEDVPHLYDLLKSRFEFDRDVTVNLVHDLPLVDVGFDVGSYIAYEAALKFQLSSLGSGVADQALERSRRLAWERLQDSELDQGGHNVLQDSRYVRYVVGRSNRLRGL